MHFVSFVLLSSILLVPVTRALETLKSDAFVLGIILAVVTWQFVYLAVASFDFILAMTATGPDRRSWLPWRLLCCTS